MKKFLTILIIGVILSVTSFAQDVVYLKSGTAEFWWGRDGNQIALNNTFGVGNWTKMHFEGLNVNQLLSSDVKFIFSTKTESLFP